MADDRHYVPGDNYILDDLSGFKVRVSHSRRIPAGQTGGAQVAIERWEAQQPQDNVRSVVDNQTVAIARPRQQNQFVVVGTWVTAPSARLTDTIEVDDAVGFAAGDIVQIMLDSGDNFITGVTGVSGHTLTLAQVLPESVGGSYGDPIENMVLRLFTDGLTGGFVLSIPGRDILNFNVLT